MSDTDSERPRQVADSEPGVSGEHATDAFALLGNETRLEILRAIWEEQVPLAEDNTVPFSRIFDRVDYDDRGSFSYHLERLEGRFITQHTERGGYELTIPGLKLIRNVVAGTGVEDAVLEPTEIDQPCPLCGATTEITYQRGCVFLLCPECEAPPRADVEGLVGAVYFEPAGIADRTPEELHAASMAAKMNQTRSLFDRVCPTCSGPVEGRLECCPDHDPSGGCERCGMRFGTLARFRCRVCKYFGGGHLKAIALCHPAVAAFYDDHGVSTRVRADDFESAKRVYELLYDYDLDRLSEDPPQVAVTASVPGDEIRLTFDDTVSVVDVER